VANKISTRSESEQAMVGIDCKVSSPARLRMATLVMAAMTAALAVSGCANKDGMTTGSIPDDYRQRHPIVLAQAEHNVDLPVSEGDRRITPGMRDTIRGFAQDYRAHATGNVEILSPRGSMNSPTASIMARQIRQELVASGIPSARIVNSAYPAGGASDAAPIRLHFMATTAVTNACGQWPEDLADRPFDNQNYYNFGCAQQNNLAAQVANPTDLVAPRAQTPIDAEQRGKVISDYRTGTVPTSTLTSTAFGG
jgi:pilus assembly protein CpaD